MVVTASVSVVVSVLLVLVMSDSGVAGADASDLRCIVDVASSYDGGAGLVVGWADALSCSVVVCAVPDVGGS